MYSADPSYGCDKKNICKNARTTSTHYIEDLMHKYKEEIYTIHPEVAKWLRTPYEYKKSHAQASLGFQVMIMMLHNCQKVDLYGFSGESLDKYFNEQQVSLVVLYFTRVYFHFSSIT